MKKLIKPLIGAVLIVLPLSGCELPAGAEGLEIQPDRVTALPSSQTVEANSSSADVIVNPSDDDEVADDELPLAVTGDDDATTQPAAPAPAKPVSTAPVITAQPVNVNATSGTTANLRVTASGENLTYAWETSTDGGATWQPVPGQTSPVFAATADNSMRGSSFRAVVTNPQGSVTSSEATIYINSTLEDPIQAGTRISGGWSNFTIMPATMTDQGDGKVLLRSVFEVCNTGEPEVRVKSIIRGSGGNAPKFMGGTTFHEYSERGGGDYYSIDDQAVLLGECTSGALYALVPANDVPGGAWLVKSGDINQDQYVGIGK